MNTGWKPAPRELNLSPDYVDVWRSPLNLPRTETEYLQALLSREEKARAGRYKSGKRLRQFIISRGLLRKLIGQCLNLNPAGFEFAYTEHQKPFLPVSALGVAVTFNITHSHNMILVALSLERSIGIDIEYIRPDVEFRKLAKRFFSGEESALLESCTKSGLPGAFFACWTRKEAFVKALGDGISFGLSEFSVSVEPHESQVNLHTHWDRSESRKWSIMNIEAGAEYAAAVAASGRKFGLRLWSVGTDF